MGLYRLTQGMHVEDGMMYEAPPGTPGKPAPKDTMPIIASKKNLVKRFPDRFEKVTAEEIAAGVTASKGVSLSPAPDTDEEEEDLQVNDGPVAEAAKAGAAGIAPDEQPGVPVTAEDVTDRFPEAQEAGLNVYREDTGKGKYCYLVLDTTTNRVLPTEEALTSLKQCGEFLKQYAAR